MKRKTQKRTRLLPQVILTDRDGELLKLASVLGVVTRPLFQIALAWDCVSDVNRRLRKLAGAGFLDCRREIHLPGVPPIYRLGKRGVARVSELTKANVESVERRRQLYHGLSENMVRHELLVAEFGCRLRHALTLVPESGLLEWLHASELPSLCNPGTGFGTSVLKPDAYASFHVGQLKVNSFLEADCGTEPLRRMSEKVEQYRVFKADGLFAERFKARGFRLLILTLSPRRAESISHHLRETSGVKVFVTDIGAIKADPLFAPVWYVQDGSRLDQRQGLVAVTPEGR